MIKYFLFFLIFSFRLLVANQDNLVPIEDYSSGDSSIVTDYWSDHTVNSQPFQSAEESLEYLELRSKQYPLFPELMDLWGDHANKVVLDFGCGPGNDVVGFLEYSNAKLVIGMDISLKALQLAGQRISLHKNLDLNRIRLIRSSDSNQYIPLPDNSVDYIYSEGVLHHTTDPLAILGEFHRILKDDGEVCIMVYNRDSIWMHLYVAYILKILNKQYQGLTDDEAFTRTTDGDNCPISRCYRPKYFLDLCQMAGFSGNYLGGYFPITMLEYFYTYWQQALMDNRLRKEHIKFLKNITIDKEGYPLYGGKYAGIGGIYKLKKEPLPVYKSRFRLF